MSNPLLLDGMWTLYYEENRKCADIAFGLSTIKDLKKSGFKSICAAVPGNFELDMQREGLLPDLFFGKNALLARKLENLHLWYAVSFEITDTDSPRYLCFEGVDTFADVYLNGSLVGKTDNMLIPYEFEANSLKSGINELVVHIIPVFLTARKNTMGAGILYHQPYNADSVCIRKAPHMFGWDIMPRIMSGGLWRSVYLREKNPDRIEEVYVAPFRADRELGSLHVYYKTSISDDFTDDYRLVLKGVCKDSTFCEERHLWHTEGRTFVHIQKPYLWWPKGMGEANLYSVTVSLYRKEELLDSRELYVGVRTVRLEKTDMVKDGIGEFCFYVNNQRMFVRGTNWVPADAFHSRDKERIPRALELLDGLNCNMVRCWGGNVYEDNDFFDFCDRKGIAVWQDFAMACSYYPQTDEFAEKIRLEAVSVVKKIRNHPALFIWVGDNECDITITGWHPFRQNPNENILTRDVLRKVIKNEDPFRAYLPSSPYISQKAFEQHSEKLVPEMHLWGPRKYFKADYYSKAVCRFASEMGYHGCPSPKSLKKFLSPDKLWPWQDNDEWLVHASCMEDRKGAVYSSRIPLMANQINELFGITPDNIEHFSVASQITQAEGDKYFIERFRLGKWKISTGIMWWNLIDGWPQFSDSAVDYYYEPKLAYYVIKRVQETVCLMFREPSDNALTLAVSNDSLRDKDFSYVVTDAVSGKIIIKGNGKSPANLTVDIASIKYEENQTVFYLIEWQIDGKEYRNHYISGKAPVSYDICLEGYKKSGLIK